MEFKKKRNESPGDIFFHATTKKKLHVRGVLIQKNNLNHEDDIKEKKTMHMVTCTLCCTHESIGCQQTHFRYAFCCYKKAQCDRAKHWNNSEHKNWNKGYDRLGLGHTILSSIRQVFSYVEWCGRNYHNNHMKTYNFKYFV